MGEAEDQQRALEQALRIEQLEATVEALRSERAELIEYQRVLRAHTGLTGAARELKSRAKTKLADLRSRGPEVDVLPGLALAGLPTVAGTQPPLWHVAVDLAGTRRSAIAADPPTDLCWDLDLPAGCAVRGHAGLRPGAWDMNRGGVDVLATVTPAGGEEPVGTTVLALDPGSRTHDRRWVPWRLELPGPGQYRLRLQVRTAAGAAPDYGWAVIGDPELEVPALAPRTVPPHRPVPSGDGPTISVLVPVHDPDPGLLDRTLESVFRQTSDRWELCIVDDGSRDPVVRDRLARAVAEDHRVRLHRHETAQGISQATNAALRLATAPFVATLDHDDVLAPDAIATVAAELAASPSTDVLYSDNDLVAADRHRFSAALKPDWSPDLLRACMYTLHLGVYRRSLVEEIGGWRPAFDGAQDHDLVLRLSERTDRIRHVPRILAHWRAHAGSAALGELAKPTAYERGRAAIAEHLGRTGHVDATVERLPEAGRYRVRYPRTLPVRVQALVRQGATGDELHDFVQALLGMLRPDDLVSLATAEGAAAIVDSAFGRATDARVVAAFPQTDEPHVALYLDGLLLPESADAIDELAGHVEAGVAAAGGLVLDQVNRVVAGGVAFPNGLPVPLHAGADVSDPARHPSLTMVTNRLAVAGAVAVSGATPPPSLSGLGLVAMSLEASAGGRVVWSPHARFCAPRSDAIALTTWPVAAAIALDRGAAPDPCWNPQLWPDGGGEVVPAAVHENPLLDVADA